MFLEFVVKEIFLKIAVSNLRISSPTDERDFEDFLLDFEEDLKAHHSVQCSPSPGMKLPNTQESKHNTTRYLKCRTNSESETKTGTLCFAIIWWDQIHCTKIQNSALKFRKIFRYWIHLWMYQKFWSPLADPHSRPLTTGIDLVIKGMGKQRFSSAKKRIIEQNLCSLIHLQSWSNSSQLHWVILHLSFSNNTQFSSMRRHSSVQCVGHTIQYYINIHTIHHKGLPALSFFL